MTIIRRKKINKNTAKFNFDDELKTLEETNLN